MKPIDGGSLFLYLSINPVVLRSLLVKEKAKGQVPVYYVRKIFFKVKYLEIEKYFYVLVVSARKLHLYFHVNDIKVLTNQPLKHILQNLTPHAIC